MVQCYESWSAAYSGRGSEEEWWWGDGGVCVGERLHRTVATTALGAPSGEDPSLGSEVGHHERQFILSIRNRVMAAGLMDHQPVMAAGLDP